MKWCCVGWSSDGTALRRLAPSEISGTLTGLTKDNHHLTPTILVPWHCTYVLPELLGETNRVGRFQALARYSDNQSVVIGYDCVPLTIGETGTEAKVGTFARYLSAVAHTDRMATVSAAAAIEFRGWRTMLQGAGIDGPEITPISLPMSPSPLDEDATAFARKHLAARRFANGPGGGQPYLWPEPDGRPTGRGIAVAPGTRKFQPTPGG